MTNYFACDMHVHTCYSHDCNTPMQAIKDFCEQTGIAVAITDHNKIAGSLAAQAMNIPNIPAIEVTTKHNKDFLCYFHTYEQLIDFYAKHIKPALNPGRIWQSKTRISEQQLIQAVKEHQGFISLAHPYAPLVKKSADISPRILREMNAVEVMNFTMSTTSNIRAAHLCEEMGVAHTAGSDSHHPSTLGKVHVRGQATNPQEFLTEVMQARGIVVGLQRKNKDLLQKARHFIQALQ